MTFMRQPRLKAGGCRDAQVVDGQKKADGKRRVKEIDSAEEAMSAMHRVLQAGAWSDATRCVNTATPASHVEDRGGEEERLECAAKRNELCSPSGLSHPACAAYNDGGARPLFSSARRARTRAVGVAQRSCNLWSPAMQCPKAS